ncbi:aminoglycoside phosphotransferase family protein [Halanaerobiaceae bacterium Z-7014]|uniref:Aminoglycoside phosphotransferase family protein n=1 Tax=Halonatronomonas betaini TaxID=2778430 RepID=A0A931ATB4_9FIRM|nr:aminoglycoside phosphotransferase family protein [Halonatronomonas betaini]MBF8436085.1 aminoglycoside phosphotransferase family protein [Halonatronomonas betaini]
MSNKKISAKTYQNLKTRAEEILEENLAEKREVEGLQNNNWVFLTVDNKSPYLVKFVPAEEKERLTIERKVYQFVNDRLDITVPEVLAYGESEYGDYLVREVIEGQSLKDYLTDGKKNDRVLYQAGQLLAKLHQIEFEEKGIFTSDLKVKEYDIFSKVEYNKFLEKLYDHEEITEKEYSLLKQVDVDYYFKRPPYVFCHSDYSPNNILVNDDDVVSIIDMEWACSAPYMDDLASFDLFLELEGFNYGIEEYYKGYNSIKEIDDYYFEHKNFYKFYRLVTMLSYQVAAEDERFDNQFLENMKAKFRSQLTNYPDFKSI